MGASNSKIGVIRIPARLKRAGIQRRLDICLATEADPDLTYRQIQQRFKASSTIVADALKGGRERWDAMLTNPGQPQDSPILTQGVVLPDSPERQPRRASTTHVEYTAMTIEPLAGRGDPAPYRYHVAGRDWQQGESPGIDGLLGDLAKEGWELVYMARAGFGRGTAAFEGTYECILKR